ncbi:MAG: prepilin-type N-terminal cleavage/methylation domain-containing protein [Lachnospirales bacterium]
MVRKGFTLLEVIIVITLISIIGAVVIPNFTNATVKTKLQSDIESAKILQSAIDLYNAQEPESISESTSIDTFDKIVTELNSKEYIKQKKYVAQSSGAKFIYDSTNNIVLVDVTSSPDDVTASVEKINENDSIYLTGVTEK